MDHQLGVLGILCLLKQWWPSLGKGNWFQQYSICSKDRYFQTTSIWRYKKKAQEPIKLLNPVSGSSVCSSWLGQHKARSPWCVCACSKAQTQRAGQSWWTVQAVQPELCTELGFPSSGHFHQLWCFSLSPEMQQGRCPRQCSAMAGTRWQCHHRGCPKAQLLVVLQPSVMGSGVLLAKPHGNSCRWELKFPIALWGIVLHFHCCHRIDCKQQTNRKHDLALFLVVCVYMYKLE